MWETETVPSEDGAAELVLVLRKGLQAAQGVDPALRRCYPEVVSRNTASGEQVNYFIANGILMRRWNPKT